MEGVIEPRDIVWAKLAGFPWWPGYVESVEGQRAFRVMFFGDGSHACLPLGKVRLWADRPELPKRPARHSRLSRAIDIARECVEQSAREQPCEARPGQAEEAERVREPLPGEEGGARKATLTTADTLETSRRSTIAEENASLCAEPFAPAPQPSDAQTLLERGLLAAAETFVAQKDHHARRAVEGGLERFEQEFALESLPSPTLCSGLARLWGLCEERKDVVGACLLRKALRRLARLLWRQFLGGEEAPDEQPQFEASPVSTGDSVSTAFIAPDLRQARRVSKKIAKAVAGFPLQKPLPKPLRDDLAQRLEHLLAEQHPSPQEYRSAVLAFLDKGSREPRAEMRLQFEQFPQAFEGLPLKDYFNLQF